MLLSDEKLTPEDRQNISIQLLKALKFRGWDERCNCHACDSIREINRILDRRGMAVEEYT